jgi:hypothetical protein
MKMRSFLNAIVGIGIVFLSGCSTHKDTDVTPPPLIDESRLRKIVVDCERLDGTSYKQNVITLDIYEDSICKIIEELQYSHFPIYSISCYSNRNTTSSNKKTMHAYSAAIDINYIQNPYFDAVNGTILPSPSETTQELVDNDYYLNRNILRKGMITQKEVNIFAKHGFIKWGGNWKRPMDFMHFQVTEAIAKISAKLNPADAKYFWNLYLADPVKIANDSFFANDISEDQIVFDDIIARIRGILKDANQQCN